MGHTLAGIRGIGSKDKIEQVSSRLPGESGDVMPLWLLWNKGQDRQFAYCQTPSFLSRRQQKGCKKCLSPCGGQYLRQLELFSIKNGVEKSGPLGASLLMSLLVEKLINPTDRADSSRIGDTYRTCPQFSKFVMFYKLTAQINELPCHPR